MQKSNLKYQNDNSKLKIVFIQINLTYFFILLFSPGVAKAQISFGSTLKEYVENFYNWSIGVGLTLAIIMLGYAGYLMIVSAGDPKRVGLGKEIIVGALSGLTLLAGAKLILNLLGATS